MSETATYFFNHRLYADATRKKRICAQPGCDTRLRYTRRSLWCSLHEKPVNIIDPTAKTGAKRGRRPGKALPNLKHIMDERGIMQMDLERMSGVGNNNISAYRSGKRASAENAELLASALGVSVEDLEARDE